MCPDPFAKHSSVAQPSLRPHAPVDHPETCPFGRVAPHNPGCYVEKDFANEVLRRFLIPRENS